MNLVKSCNFYNFCNFLGAAKVVRVALENAASVAGMLLTTECVISNIKEDNPPAMPPMGGGGMPGMM